MKYTSEISHWIEAHRQEHLQLLTTLAQIPAPSNHEEKRAEFCKEWLETKGAVDVYIDSAQNVILPLNVTGDNRLVVFAAHSDVVFPDTDPLPLRVEEGRICCPGVGDDTASVAALLMAARYILEKQLVPREYGIMIVIDSGEEGLGNLKGIRHLFNTFGHRIREFISFDGGECRCVNRAVGSRRYRIAIDTEGGHSYGAFGNRNAIAYLASLIDTLYTVKVPPFGKTTYNVGTISGGTSVNTIAQHAEMLYEFRSDEAESLALMERHLDAALNFYRTKGIRVTSELVGDRPCSASVDDAAMSEMIARAQEATMRHYDRELVFSSGSTDCNIPLSMGIAAICLGCYRGHGAHTREEFVELDSLIPGMKFVFDILLHHF